MFARNCVLIIFVLGAFLYAQTENSVPDDMQKSEGNKIPLTLDDALDLAGKNDLKLMRIMYDYDIAKARKGQTVADFYMPVISVGGNFSLVDEQVANRSVSMYGLKGSQDQWGLNASISKVLFTGFRLWNSDKISDINLKIASENYDYAVRDVNLTTKMNFYNLFLLQESYKVFLNTDQTLKKRLDTIQVQYRNGMVSEYEYLRIKVQYENNKPQILNLSNTYYVAKLDFIKKIGINEKINDVELVGSLTDALDIVIPELEEEKLVSEIMLNNTDIKNMQHTIDILDYSRKIANGYWFPTLSASAGYTGLLNDKVKLTPTPTLKREWDNGWQIGVQLSYQLDNLIPVSKPAQQAKEAKLKREQADVTYRELRQNIEVHARSLINTIVSKKQSLISQKENSDTALYAFNMAVKQYLGGSISTLDLNDAEIAYQEAQLNYLKAIHDYYSSAIELLRLLGM